MHAERDIALPLFGLYVRSSDASIVWANEHYRHILLIIWYSDRGMILVFFESHSRYKIPMEPLSGGGVVKYTG